MTLLGGKKIKKVATKMRSFATLLFKKGRKKSVDQQKEERRLTKTNGGVFAKLRF